MGGRGSSSRTAQSVSPGRGSSIPPLMGGIPVGMQATPQPQPAPQPQQPTPQQQIMANMSNSQSWDDFLKADDATKAQIIQNAMNLQREEDYPAWLADTDTQRLSFALGMQGKPEIVDDTTMASLLKNSNNLAIWRTMHDGSTLTGKQKAMQLTDSQFYYVGGENGANVYGYGSYFSTNQDGSRLYGDGTRSTQTNYQIKAVIDTTQIKPIYSYDISSEFSQWSRKYPQAAAALSGANEATKALAMGYNCITSDMVGGRNGYGNNTNNEVYYNILDRSIMKVSRTNVY